LATFFYATNGPTTWDSFIRDNGWLTDAPECEWGSTANNQCTKGVYTSLTLDFVGVSGTIPEEIGLLTTLERFSVRGGLDSDSVISGTMPDIFASLSSIQTIRLNDNDLSGSIPTSFGFMTNCIVLILSGNSFTGTIPAELATTQTRILNLNNNQLSGQIPSELFTLPELQIINFDDNYLVGTIPSDIGNATSISSINFSNNYLGGSIPSEIGNLVEIRSGINFSSNQLSGEIPSEIGQLKNMSKHTAMKHFQPVVTSLFSRFKICSLIVQHDFLSSVTCNCYTGNFEIQHNLLAGSIPEELAGLVNIELFRIDGNTGIVGSMPESVCDTFGTRTISYSDCGSKQFGCECCTYCCVGDYCECNVADANICGEDLTGARTPFL